MDERYFIVAYSINMNKITIVGNAGFETENEDYINHKEVISIIREAHGANPFEYANITSVIEVNKKEYKRFWEE